MEELLPFIFFVAWLLIGGLGAKKKREEAGRRAEAQRREREGRARPQAGQRGPQAGQRESGRASRDADRDFGYGDTRDAPDRASAGTSSEPEGTALDMVPDELWDILTGGAPRPPRSPMPTPAPEPEPEPVEEWRAAGPDEGGWVTAPPWNEEAAVDSIEGVSYEEVGRDTFDYDDQADRIARARYETVRPSRRERASSYDAAAVRADETSDARHMLFHQRLRESEIGTGSVARAPSGKARLGLRNMSDVRRAIVLAEVLGPPKSLQM